MIYKIAQFKVKKEKLDVAKEAIVEFVDAIKEHEPGVARYESFQLEDGVSLIHFMAFNDEEAEAYHRTALHTKQFVGVLYPNCEEEPVFSELKLVR